MEQLSYAALESLAFGGYYLKDAPERIIQFGDGNFLRAFADSFFDLANELSGFHGKIVVVTPNSGRNVAKFTAQDGLYTLYLRGMENGEKTEQKRLISVISRCINGVDDFAQVLSCAQNAELKFIVSNTTEAGICFRDSDRFDAPGTAAFPGKLTRFLYERYQTLGLGKAPGFLILPCELIEHNGETLKECVKEYAGLWGLGSGFAAWVEESNVFCSTLVDRIVPGFPKDDAARYAQENGYTDALLVAAEPFGFWAIEGDSALNDVLPFAKTGLPVLVTPDITFYKQRKVRVLNGGHTSMTCAALLTGVETVGQCMEDRDISRFLRRAVYDEIIPASGMPQDVLCSFADAVMDRFRNPFIRHELISITLNTTSKWRARVLPSLKAYMQTFGTPPVCLCFGFAANIVFARCGKFDVKDDPDVLAFFAEHGGDAPAELCRRFCARTDFWGEDLNLLPGFADTVTENLNAIACLGARAALQAVLEKAEKK